MKIAIYSPYLDTLGGGEKYMMTIAETFYQQEVDVLLDENLDSIGGDYLKKELSKRFDLNLETTRFIKAPVGEWSNSFSRLFFLKKYDLLFYLTDGSIFIPFAKRNILHVQSPLFGQPAKGRWGKIKLKRWDLIIYNSHFTQKHSENNWPLKSQVIYPPVDVDKIKPLKKKKYILSVGRFFGFLKDKKHQLLIKSFRNLQEDVRAKDWSLHLVGSASEGDKNYLEDLKKEAGGLDINFYPNLSYDELVKLYGLSSIYWHAAGYGEDDPTKMEHFGISTVEAMAAGCVPVVIGKGGQKEIVEDGESGYLWQTEDELSNLTLRLITDANIFKKTSRQAIKRAKNFSKEKFERQILSLINK